MNSGETYDICFWHGFYELFAADYARMIVGIIELLKLQP
jgi:hypothetical protein